MNSGVLHQLRRRTGTWLALKVALTVACSVGLLALAAVLADAALDLPSALRSSAPWVLVLLAIFISLRGIVEWRRRSEVQLARTLEGLHPDLGSRLTNAVQLAQGISRSPIEESLRRQAIALGRDAAAHLYVWPVVRRGVLGVVAFTLVAAVCWMLMALAASDVLQAVAPRFLDPNGDHPPFSRLKIAVIPGGSEVVFGGQLEVRATISGRPADKLWLVARSATNEVRTRMFLAPDRSFFQSLANVREPMEYFVTDGSARSHRFPIRVRFTPEIHRVEIAARFPEYTGKPARTNQLGNEPFAFPKGTRVSLRVMSNRPLKSGALQLVPVLGGKTNEVELKPDAARAESVSGEFELKQPVTFTLGIRDIEDLNSTEKRSGRINVQPDEKPRLFVVEPGRDAVATPSIRIPVRIQASDDFGISKVVWLRGFNRSIERPFSMKLTLKNGAQSVEALGAFELERLGVRPGDVIDYYFEAADNYPDGPNLALSRPFRLEIISQQQFDAVVRQQLARKTLFEPYLKTDAWLRRLAERSNGLAVEAERSPDAAKQQAQELAQELAELEKALGDLMKNPAVFDLEQGFRESLVTQQARLANLRADLSKALSSGNLTSKQLSDFSQALNDIAGDEAENVGEPAQHIASVARTVAAADQFVKLAKQQATLAQLLRRFSERTNALSRMEQLEMQELAHQQGRIREALQTYMKQLPELLAQVPADSQYDPLRKDVNGFLEAVKEAQIETDLQDATVALAEPDGITGYAMAQRAADKMARLIGRCQSTPGTAQECLTARFRPTLSEQMAQGFQQILAAMGVGNGEGGRDGYGLFNEAMAVYGPNTPVSGEQAAGRGDIGRSDNSRAEAMVSDARDAGLPERQANSRVRLQPDAKFPMRYRDLVGEYFRAVAESEEEDRK